MKIDPRLKDLTTCYVTWFGAGFAKKAPGTMGSAAALPFALIIHLLFGSLGLMIASLVVFISGMVACERYLAKNPGKTDPQEIVVDEVAGQWLLLSALFPTWQSYLIGFALFRLFDVVKPWPVSWADKKVKGGAGVMLDDMLAGAFPIVIGLIILLEAHLFGITNSLVPVFQFLGGV